MRVMEFEMNRGIAAKLFTPSSTRPYASVLCIHGWEGSQEQHRSLAEALTEDGCECLTFDLAGHGKTPGEAGKITPFTHADDVCAAARYLFCPERKPVERRIVIGSSYGGALALLALDHPGFTDMLLRVPLLYRDVDLNRPHAKRNRDLQNSFRNTPQTPDTSLILRHASWFRGNVQLVTSENDTIVSKATVESYSEAFTNAETLSYAVMARTPHSLTERQHVKEFIAIVQDWIDNPVPA